MELAPRIFLISIGWSSDRLQIPRQSLSDYLLRLMTNADCALGVEVDDDSKVLSCCSTAQSFPTPMEEPKKILRAQYLGSMQVSRPGGMDILNEAIDTLVSTVPSHQWQHVNIGKFLVIL